MEQSLQKLCENSPDELAEAIREMDLLAWIRDRRREVSPGNPYQDPEPWLIQPHEDQAREKVFMKAAQVRVSELLISEALWRMDAHHWSVYYSFPTTAKMSKFVKGRIDPAIATSPKLKAKLGTDDVSVKSLGGAMIYFSGAQKLEQITSDAVDMVIRDDFDFIPPANHRALLQRKADSEHGFVRDASHPRYPGTGIDLRHEVSDRKQWQIPCPEAKCGHEQPLITRQLRSTDRAREMALAGHTPPHDQVWVECQRCGSRLDRLAPGRWVPQAPGSPISGYQIGRLMSSRANLGDYLLASLAASEFDKQTFHNMDEGLPYSPAGATIPRKSLDALINSGYHLPGGAELSFMGVDVGSGLHYYVEHLLEQKPHPVEYGRVLKFSELDPIMERCGVAVCVVDAMPETRSATDWTDGHPGRAIVGYLTAPRDAPLARFRGPDKLTAGGQESLSINHALACDHVYQDVVQRRMALDREAPNHPELYSHFRAMKRIVDKDKKGRTVVRWTDEEKPSHLYFARLFAVVARKMYEDLGFGRRQVVEIDDDNSGILDGDPRFTQEDDW